MMTPTMRVGRTTDRQADSFRIKVEEIAACQMLGHTPSRDTLQWLASLDDRTHNKLSAVGLVAKRERMTLGELIERFIADQRDAVKPSIVLTYRRAERHLIDYFTAERPLQKIAIADARAWAAWLTAERGLARNTARKSVSIARQFMRHAIECGAIDADPFMSLPGAVGGNQTRLRFITQADAERVLAACPDAEWRLLFALARYGGVRVPSEIVPLVHTS